MNEEKLNLSVRKFLKNVGITSQRKIEEKVREKIKSSNISNSKNNYLCSIIFGRT